MANTFYVWLDDSYTTSGHAGTSADPWSFEDLNTLSGASTSDTILLKGIRNQGVFASTSAINGLTLNAWDVNTYGPWRMKWDYWGSGNRNLKNGIIKYVQARGAMQNAMVFGSLENMVVFNDDSSGPNNGNGIDITMLNTIYYGGSNDLLMGGGAGRISAANCILDVRLYADGMFPSYPTSYFTNVITPRISADLYPKSTTAIPDPVFTNVTFSSVIASGISGLSFESPIEAFDIDVSGTLGPTWARNYQKDAFGGSRYNTGFFYFDTPLTPNTLYAAGTSGVFRSTNSGDTWQQVLASGCDAVAYLGNGVVIATSGYTTSAIVYKSLDYGNTWINSGTPDNKWSFVSSIVSTDPDFGKAVATSYPPSLSNGFILYTNDYGATWTPKVSAASTAPFNIAKFIGNSTVLALGNQLGDYRSTDFGNTWSSLSVPTPSAVSSVSVIYNRIYAVDSLDGNTVLAAGDLYYVQTVTFKTVSSPTFYKSTDAGLTWTSQCIDSTLGQIVSIGIFTSALAYAADSSGNIYRSLDNGTTWSATGGTETLNDIRILDSTKAVGAGSIKKTTTSGSSWPVVESSAGTVYSFSDFFYSSVFDFSATPLSGSSPLTVQFSATVDPSYTYFLWDFGDGYVSSATSPIHTYHPYPSATYNVTLSAGSSAYSFTNFLTKNNYITVVSATGVSITFTPSKRLAFSGTNNITYTVSASANNSDYGNWAILAYPKGTGTPTVSAFSASNEGISALSSSAAFNTTGSYTPEVYVSAAPLGPNAGFVWSNDVSGTEGNFTGQKLAGALKEYKLRIKRISNVITGMWYSDTSGVWVSATMASAYSGNFGIDIQNETSASFTDLGAGYTYFKFQSTGGFPTVSAAGAPSWVYMPRYIEDIISGASCNAWWEGAFQSSKHFHQELDGDWIVKTDLGYTTFVDISTSALSGDFDIEWGIKPGYDISGANDFASIHLTSASDASSPIMSIAYYSTIIGQPTYLQPGVDDSLLVLSNSAFTPIQINPLPAPSAVGNIIYKDTPVQFKDSTAFNSYYSGTVSAETWNFGDGFTSSTGDVSATLTHTYSAVGSKTVTISAFDISGNIGVGSSAFDVSAYPVSAEFSATPTSGENPLFVTFTNLSSGASTYNWDFGDSSTSTSADPTHTYSNSGSYTVSLSAFSGSNSATTTKNNYITVISVCADFSAVPVSGESPLTVQFTNLSQNATSYLWDFDDGSPLSASASPMHEFLTSGVFDVTLSAIGTATYSVITKQIAVITVYADFSVSPQIGQIPFTVTTTNLSQNASAYWWDFGDGSPISTCANPTHEYSTSGFYTISLSASGTSTYDTYSLEISALDVNADFTATPRTGVSPLSAQFTNLSTGATTYLWDFGDGSPLSADVDPLHEYTTEGIFTVTLSAFSASISDVEVKTSYIRVGLGHIGAFYFGPVEEVVSADVIEISAVLLQPDVTVVDNVSATTIPFYIPVYVTLLQPTVYATQDINVDFVGVPRAGSSPLVVDFTAYVELGPEFKGKYVVEEYVWCFDYDYTNGTCNIPWETSTTNTISHVYTGYRGQKYSVRCCAKLRLL